MTEQPAFNFEEDQIGLTDLQKFVAGVIRNETTAEKPIRNRELQARIKEAFPNDKMPSERRVKSIVRELRKEHGLQILARREAPAGYFWCGSAEEMKGFIDVFSSQAKDELHTLSRIVKRNYPALCGQVRIDFNV